ANLHAGAFVAPVLLGCAAAGARLDRSRVGAAGLRLADPVAGGVGDPSRGPMTDGAAARRLALAALGAAAAVFATPVGFGLLRYLRLPRTLPALHAVDEFRAPPWLPDAPLYVYAAVLGAALLLARRRRIAWAQALPPLVLVVLAAGSVRFAADAALVS